MEVMKRFFREEAGTAESTSLVVMIAAAGALLVLGLLVWYGDLNGIFQSDANLVNSMASNVPSGS
jgi:Flp pilus assembly pilin Flp